MRQLEERKGTEKSRHVGAHTGKKLIRAHTAA